MFELFTLHPLERRVFGLVRPVLRLSVSFYCFFMITCAQVDGGYVFTLSVCLSVCLSIYLSVLRINQKVVDNFLRIFGRWDV